MKNSWSFRKSAIIGLISLLTASSIPFSGSYVKAESSESNVITEFSQMTTAKKKIEEATEHFKDSDKVRVIVELEGEPAITYSTKKGIRFKDLKETKKDELISKVEEQQEEFLDEVQEDAAIDFNKENQFTTVLNGVSGEVKYGDIKNLEKIENVKNVSIVTEYERPTEKPDMLSSKEMVEAIQTWNAGYDGEGMVVGIIDTGIDYSHKDMVLDEDTDVKLSESKVSNLKETNNLSGEYFTEKVPYGYNYADKNEDVLDHGPDASMHGMHVAGTVGANGDETGNGIKGVAPEAQLLALKVFGNDQAMPSTFGDIYIKAIDDGIILGADVLNMSLGSTAGFVDSTNVEQQAIDRAVNNGVLMSISAGNSAQYGANYDNPLASNPDIGLVGSPGLSTNSISVASIENTNITLDEMSVKIGNETLPIAYKKQSSPDPTEVFGKDQDLDVVYVGDGSAKQYEGKNVKGKIVFAVRTTSNPNYGQIQAQAEAAGAAGVIIRGTPAHGDYVSMALNNPTIPLVSISIADGNTLETKIKAENGDGKVTFTRKTTKVVNGSAGEISSFSSWGVTPSLEMKPEITAPGGQIYSTLNDNKYGVMSGTSMAAPHVSGGAALVLEKVEEAFPQLSGADKVKRAKTLLMNTAKIVKDLSNDDIAYSPRQQGAGLMQLNSAVTTPVYVEATGTHEGKIELKEINDDKFYLAVTATNFGKENVTYNVGASVLTDATQGSGETAVNALKEQVISKAKVKPDAKQVTIFPGESKDIKVQIDLSEAKEELEKIQKNGYFVEGFITLTNEAEDVAYPDLSVPYLGFKGDWNNPPVLDSTIYEDVSYYDTAGLVDQQGAYLGYNPFTKEFSEKNIAISPNSDKKNDAVAPVLSFLRNSKVVDYAITDAEGKKLRTLNIDKEQRKTYFNGTSSASVYSYKPKYTQWDGKINNKVVDGTYYYQVTTQVDLAGEAPQVTKIPVIVDTKKPEISNISFGKKTGILAFTVNDTNGSGLQYLEIYVDDKKLGAINPGKVNDFTIDIGSLEDGKEITVKAYDYAFNSSESKVSTKGDNEIPYIVSDTPEALGVFDTRELPFNGYVTDASVVKTLYVKSPKLENELIDIPLTYNSVTKKYEFATNLKFTEDGVHDIFIGSSDAVENSIEFRRQVIIDTEPATLTLKNLPENNFVATGSENPTITVNVKDNFDDIFFKVNGNLIAKNSFDEPFEMRGYDKDFDIPLELEDGQNDIVFEVEDLAGHITKKTISIFKGDKVPASFVSSLSLESEGSEVTVNNPAKITAEATGAIKWEAKVVDPNGKETSLESTEGEKFEATFTPNLLDESGEYTLFVGAEGTNDDEKLKTQFTVSNYPITLSSVKTTNSDGKEAESFTKDSSVSVKAVIKNAGKVKVKPTVGFQVKDSDGAVVYFKKVNPKSINENSKTRFVVDIPLSKFEKGKYDVEVFVWEDDENPIPLAKSSNMGSFTITDN